MGPLDYVIIKLCDSNLFDKYYCHPRYWIHLVIEFCVPFDEIMANFHGNCTNMKLQFSSVKWPWKK